MKAGFWRTTLETSFEDFNQWLYNDIAVFSFRVDKKTLPANLFRATVQREVAAWCEERGVERCPKSQKDEIKDRIEKAWLKRCLPRVQVTEVCIASRGVGADTQPIQCDP